VKLVVATQNSGKLREYRTLLAESGVDLSSLADYPGAPQVEETGDTYLANARLKARALAAFCQLPALADDSGLEVDALNGLPGVRSARFAADAGQPAGDRSNVSLLLDRLAGVPDARRTARFRCVIVVARPDGHELIAEDTCEGRITRAARGSGGFGFDPVFLYPPLQRTFAELDAAEKDRVSHRAGAVRRLTPALGAFLSD
jgi:XTP/dITP diphosphohydrolase